MCKLDMTHYKPLTQRPLTHDGELDITDYIKNLIPRTSDIEVESYDNHKILMICVTPTELNPLFNFLILNNYSLLTVVNSSLGYGFAREFWWSRTANAL